jgi:hypothetical protein
MQRKFAVIGLASSAFVLVSFLQLPASAPAFAGMFGDVMRHGLGVPVPGGGGGWRHHRRGGGGGSGGEESDNNDRKSKSFTEVVRDSANFWAQQEEDRERERANKLERERNVDKAIDKFILTLRGYHEQLKRTGVTGSLVINQVTAGELKTSLDEAYRQGHLSEFERYTGELWTRDRLMVLTLRYAEEGLKPYFFGVGARGPSVDEIKTLLSKSARDIHAAALELGEMVGVSLSYDRFIRTIYENSDRADEGLWKPGADGKYERLGTALIDTIPREQFISRDTMEADTLGLERQFLYRFRARRSLYDCLAGKYPQFISAKEITVSAPSGSSGVWGWSKGLIPQSSPQKEAASSLAASSGEEPLWKAAGKLIDRYCSNTMGTVAMLVSTGKLKPESARSDTSGITSLSNGSDNNAEPASYLGR